MATSFYELAVKSTRMCGVRIAVPFYIPLCAMDPMFTSLTDR